MYKEIFSIRIKQTRQDLGLSQATVAAETQIARSSLSMYETGKLEPSLEQLGILASYYDVSTDWLLGIGAKKIRS